MEAWQTCSLCKDIPETYYCDGHMASPDLPANVSIIIDGWPRGSVKDDTPFPCPSCGTIYLLSYSCGFGENDITLQRSHETQK